ncbi:hypothetical protein ABIA60_003546 [Pseudomonas frederiksbergensis]
MIIVERKEDWASYFPSEDIVTAQEYLEQTRDNEQGKRVQVINLCRSYKYLGHGYYCSLAAGRSAGAQGYTVGADYQRTDSKIPVWAGPG